MATRQFNGLEIPSPGTFTIDPAHSRVGFVARHLMVSKVRGSFGKVTGEIVVAENPADSTVHVSIDVDSITTGVEQRDAHLRSGDFFEMEKYPTAEFVSTGVTIGKGNEFTLHGNLTLKGVTKSVDLDGEFEGAATSPYGQEIFGFEASGEIDREDWGMTYNMALETGGVMISKKIKIEIEGEAIRQA